MILIIAHDTATDGFGSRLEACGMAFATLGPGPAEDWISGASTAEVAAIEGIIVLASGESAAAVATLRQKTDAPLIVVGEEASLDWRIGVLAAGADDLVPSQTHARELLARVAAVRRRSADAKSPAAASAADVVVFADGRDPLVAGTPMSLPRRERRILECLARHRGAWLSKTQVFNEVYSVFNERFGETVIESHICRLRKRLADRLGYIPIRSQRHLGYRLELQGAPASAAFQRANGAILKDGAEFRVAEPR